MTQPVKDCQCEDFPCCEHADNFPSTEPEYCDLCGRYGHSPFECQDGEWQEDEDEVPEHDPGPQVDDEGGMSEVEWPMPIGSEEF
jgi:hypothetical protein